MSRECGSCGEFKQLKMFYKDRTRKDGYRTTCAECDSEQNRKYRRINREKLKFKNKAVRTPEKTKAGQITRTAIKNGTLKRPGVCMSCMIVCKPEAHHEDYRAPLDVVWLCKSCHSHLHFNKKKKEGNMPKFRYKNRNEISKFLAGINESVATIIDIEASKEARMAAQRTGPHLSHHLTELVEEEMNAAHLDKNQEWEVKEIAKHLLRTTISNGFTFGGLAIAGFEQLTLDLISRYEAGDYSYSIEETRMNKRSEELRTVHTVDDGTSEIPEMLKAITELIDTIAGDRAEIKMLTQDELIAMLKKELKEEDPEEEEE